VIGQGTRILLGEAQRANPPGDVGSHDPSVRPKTSRNPYVRSASMGVFIELLEALRYGGRGTCAA
jgi:hypothetical protein